MADNLPPTSPSRHLDIAAVRFARPTAHYDAVLEFYRDCVGLPVLAAWRNHRGYDGMVFGLPGSSVQMELLQRTPPEDIPDPDPENQLVLYLGSGAALEVVAARLRAHGHTPVPAANPYWNEHGAVLFADPDGWMVVLAPWVFGE
ncbi:VOC family protein [Williamsia sp. CHRR-6]|uniref:VOC family protein n=1 Tax=Williamsia sp. CHRR-6 TaxID=2835871 RepID=UPI001BDAC8BF|nr:VOC family protein [Williamsia sp. CHRR-6]MBT0566353.1 VOC family protein [Williamsia sp. CHRR-6]